MIEEGTILQDRYHVAKQIGAGGMGAVYIGTDQRFGSTVAIKETFFSDENLTKAFEREARLLNSLRHPALPRVSDHFIDSKGGGQFIVMEYISGEDLAEMLDRRVSAFSVAEVMTWGDQLLDALDYLHTQEMPVVHRDIKPQNLKLTPRGQMILLDFGLAKGNPTDSNHQTNTKSIFGFSRVYAPLEQIQGTGTDPRSDLYSLAATLYHLMTGTPPEDALTRATAVLNGNPDPLRAPGSINPQISAPISDVLMNAMALNANFRPSSAAAMRAVLADAKNNISPNFAAQETIIAVPGSAAIFDQKTQVIGDGQTITAPNVSDPLTGQTQEPIWSGGINVQIPSTETVTNVRAFSSTDGTNAQKKSSFGLRAVGAAAAVILLVAGCATAIFMYNRDAFQQSPVNSLTSDSEGEKKSEQPANTAATADGAQGAEAHAESEKTGEAKNPRDAAATTDTAKEGKASVATGTGQVSVDAPEDVDVEKEAEQVGVLSAQIEAARRAGKHAEAADMQVKMQRSIQRMVREKLRNANINDPEVEKEMEEAFRQKLPMPPANFRIERRQENLNTNNNLPRRRPIIIQQRPAPPATPQKP